MHSPQPNSIPLALDLLLLWGAIFLLVSLVPVKRIVADLPPGNLRRWWKLLGVFIVFFIISYLGYILAIGDRRTGLPDLIVPMVFFLGGVFVLLVAYLALKTTLLIRRVATLERENITDALTGLYNRRYLDMALSQEIQRARRYAYPLSVLLLDVDHFKEINDTYGHQKGDQVLTYIGSRIRSLVRESDSVARYGGDEFAVIAPHINLEAAETLADRIRKNLATGAVLPPCPTDAGAPITVSIGAAELQGMEEGCELIEWADQALYRAKKRGRNLVAVRDEFPERVPCGSE